MKKKTVGEELKDIVRNFQDEPYVELSEKQRNSPCYFIGEVCMTHARMRSICDRLKVEVKHE